jgi:hypothetical protein
MYRLIVTVLLPWLCLSTDIMTSSATLTSNLTLAPSVTYNIQLFLNTLINSGSVLQIWFSNMYTITTVNGCQATINSSVALSSVACYATNTSTLYYVNYDTLFTTTATITNITLSVNSK